MRLFFLIFNVIIFSTPVFAKKMCFPSEDTKLLLGEGGSIPSDSDSFYYSASRLPKIIKCSETGELSSFYCIEWEGSVYNKKAKETTQGARIVFNDKTGLVVDFIASTNQPGFKYKVNNELVVIGGDLKKNIIELINAQFLQSKAKFPQMALAQSLDRPNVEDSIQRTLNVILSLLKESTGSLHLNCKNYSRFYWNVNKAKN